MSPLIFAIVVIVISLVKAFTAARQSSGEAPPDSRPAGPARRPAESEEERQRRFMEALGLPANTGAPPTVRPRTKINTPPPLLPVDPPGPPFLAPGRLRRVQTAPPSPAAKRAPEPPARRVPPPPAPAPAPAQAPAAAPAAPAAPPAYAVQMGRAAAAPVGAPVATGVPSTAGDLLVRLRDPASIRQAIILREVLGPPKAFQIG